MTARALDELDRLLATARDTVATGYYARLPATAPRRVGPSLKRALISPPRGQAALPVIAEIKPASPTAGTLRAGAASDAGKLSRAFVDAGARGVSVLAEPTRFGGSLEAVAAAAHAGVPVLFKDFVLAESQLDAAVATGASAVLLILLAVERGATEWPDASSAVRAAQRRGLEVLLEVYTREEYAQAARVGADLVGVNNRDLRTLVVDPMRTRDVLASGKLAPTLALSGAESRADVEAQVKAGADGVLIGSALMRARDPVEKLRELVS